MPRLIYLALFSNGPHPAHWSIFIPTLSTGQQGEIIHVTGTTVMGFFLEFKRNYDFAIEDRKYQIIPLADVEERFVTDAVGDGTLSCHTTARDRLESAATVVKPPGPSREPFGKDSRNCQHWMIEYVQRLADEGFLAVCAVDVLVDAPRRF
ncbi:hypothetical protein BDV33DRAFT_205151 [Aspergillus novoparasiticus]|uniref:PPPDE domain-containing protein n=1 Tax=Aspergillus novoparasiticus TaxID=986946 RepID=A0A5N6EMA1_9EURO|nr:hypothetical protein BDV33DRAFT_205151 [Aspergillus novoparasiticus]